ncbi:MAG: hypothetical protein AAGA45_01200 [Verrucomicrobiota bacterium]
MMRKGFSIAGIIFALMALVFGTTGLYYDYFILPWLPYTYDSNPYLLSAFLDLILLYCMGLSILCVCIGLLAEPKRKVLQPMPAIHTAPPPLQLPPRKPETEA